MTKVSLILYIFLGVELLKMAEDACMKGIITHILPPYPHKYINIQVVLPCYICTIAYFAIIKYVGDKAVRLIEANKPVINP